MSDPQTTTPVQPRNQTIDRMRSEPRKQAGSQAGRKQPITVQITREVDPEASGEVEQWVSRGQAMLRYWPGYLGSGWVRNDSESHTWHMLYRFSDAKTLKSWEASPQRRAWASELADHVQSERSERRTGIEGWFDTKPFHEQAADDSAPPRWKQMIVIFLGFFPMSLLGNVVIGLLLPAATPLVLRVLATTVLVMPIMVYFVLPLFTTKLFAGWLNKPRRPRSRRQRPRRARRRA
ncbi:antibiotic biosynthesis monooxygenase [Brevibacterium sp. 50QC2O2]|uniref:antibiotic biosynthesis monooxygenase n=1 Tax=Brevibacterium TaxID=1696 RepID=UPI00211B951B|nr:MULTISPECIES: antibiotic biosynthesis monooxygenase [unclassified Brevibacterium]MCQ9385191.1 antibiotic biosynthesis monooxygenase [Brevibacterium sp. 68QC2CO]MCQ9387814.1 antibiotic biosynthesis monooxygenase [Brevibacterium sp. 50QC2O2]